MKTQITTNFSKEEFNSKDGATMPDDVFCNVVKLANQLQILRNHLGKPIIINSGYRSPQHNKKVGGSPNSQHLLGKACDIRTGRYSPLEIYNTIEKLILDGGMMQGGLGLYDTFVHYDIRKTKARWDFRTRE